MRRRAAPRYSVYIFRQGSCYKIGFSQNVRLRLSAVNTASAQDVELVKAFEFVERQTAKNVENHLHRIFSAQRLRNKITGELKEWFTLSATDLERIEFEVSRFNKPPAGIPERLKEAFRFSQYLASRMKAQQ